MRYLQFFDYPVGFSVHQLVSTSAHEAVRLAERYPEIIRIIQQLPEFLKEMHNSLFSRGRPPYLRSGLVLHAGELFVQICTFDYIVERAEPW